MMYEKATSKTEGYFVYSGRGYIDTTSATLTDEGGTYAAALRKQNEQMATLQAQIRKLENDLANVALKSVEKDEKIKQLEKQIAVLSEGNIHNYDESDLYTKEVKEETEPTGRARPHFIMPSTMVREIPIRDVPDAGDGDVVAGPF